MRLYYSPRACSLASRIALHEIGADVEYERVDLRTKQTEAGRDFRDVNPLGYVPVLELDDGAILTESPAILSYIADLRPGTLAPDQGTFERVRLHQALAFVSGELHKSFSPLIAGVQGPTRDLALARLESRLDHVEQQRADGRQYFVEDQYTVADAYAFVILSWSPHLGVTLEKWPHIRSYLERIGSRRAVQAALAEELPQ
jgi:glutathione S-transferase